MLPSDLDLCGYAAAAYTSPATFVVAGDVYCVVTDTPNATIFSFRGTVPTSLEDWERDVYAWPTELPDHPRLGRLHSGFARGADAALEPLRAILPTRKPIVATAHSLGGALAIATTALLVDSGVPVACCTTFGAPRISMDRRVGDILCETPGKRYRNGRDPVPPEPALFYLTDRPWTCLTSKHPTAFILDDHYIASYMEALKP